MGFFDDLLGSAKASVLNQAKQTVSKTINDVASGATQKISRELSLKKENFCFQFLPTSVEELKSMPEASLDSAYKTAALTLAVLCNFKNDIDTTYAMLDVLKGPQPLNPMEKQFIKERLTDAEYKPFSFFQGATVDNGYEPDKPYTITIMSNQGSFAEENWANLFVKSSGADFERKIILRKKPSTNQWFLNQIQCLSDIRIPKAEDPWA